MGVSVNGKLASLYAQRAAAGQAFAQQGADERTFVPYMDLGRGLNTRKDPHALDRTELAVLVNMWYSQGESISKRPGLTPLVTKTGAAGVGASIISIAATRFGNQTWLLIQDSSNTIWYAPAVASGSPFQWKSIGGLSGGIMRTAQMYDPQRNADAVFIVSGFDVPQYWLGPNTTLKQVDTSTGHLPTKAGSTVLPITPAYVATLGNNSHLFYSGESTAPSGVYVSDPFYPESFTTPLTQVNPMNGSYAPALIGNNDGVDGGAITGMRTLGSAMVIFKQSAVYAMNETQLFGDVAFDVDNISSSVGCLSPRSIEAMDGFLCFLGVDGVYATDGNTAWQISGNVPTFFDSTVLGYPALIQNRATAVAFRHGTRYIVFFDTGTGYADTGVWFDFAVQADQGLPGCGQMNFSAPTGSKPLYLGGAVTLRGPQDDGNVAVCSSTFDFVGKFGLGFSDICSSGNQPASTGIAVRWRGKADFFEDVLGADAPAATKNVDQIHLFVSIFQTAQSVDMSFFGNVINDIANTFPIEVPPFPLPQQAGPRWGTPAEGGSGVYWKGGALWTSAPLGTGLYYDLAFLSPQSAWGKIIQLEFSESSPYGFTVLGYSLQVGKAQVVA